MLSLPTEIITVIAHFLEPKERTKLREINTFLNKLFSDHRLWQDMSNEFIRDKFQTICKIGNLCSAQWLTQYFDLTQEDARSSDNYALRYAQKNGHTHIIEWLKNTFDIS